jgi:multidrug efflux pump subunit AcrA (membrane-fusion protein)
MTIGLTVARAHFAACATTAALALVLSACGQENRYVAPPPPKVTVALPVQQKVTRYLEATGYASAINTTNLVARVQGFLQKINYKDGDQVKEGATLFIIEPEPYRLKLEQARGRRGRRPSNIEADRSGIRTAG